MSSDRGEYTSNPNYSQIRELDACMEESNLASESNRNTNAMMWTVQQMDTDSEVAESSRESCIVDA